MQARRGEVVLVLFPNSDLRTAKRRPALGAHLQVGGAIAARSAGFQPAFFLARGRLEVCATFHRQPAKRRPALVLQRDDLANGLAQTIVAMISSNPTRSGHLSRITVLANSSEGRAAGLRLDSIIMTDNLATADSSERERVDEPPLAHARGYPPTKAKRASWYRTQSE